MRPRLALLVFLTLLLGMTMSLNALTINVPGDYGTIQEAVAIAASDDIINVFPGVYSGGTYVTINQEGLTIRGVDSGGNPITSAADVAATVGPYEGGEAQMTIHVVANNVTITGIRIADQSNKAMTINGDNFTLTNCRFENAWDLSGAIYFLDASPGIKSVSNPSVQRTFTITGNVIKGWGVAITDGTGFGWPASGRIIANNTFGISTQFPGYTFYSIGFRSVNGTGWCNSPVGGATITGNTFLDMGERGYVYFDGSVPAEGLDFQAIMANNTFALGAAMAFDSSGQPRPLLPTDPFYNAVTKPNQVMLKNSISAEIAKAQAGDIVNVTPGSYAVDLHINKALTLNGANAWIPYGPGRGPETILTPSLNSAAVVNIESDNVTLNGFEITADMSNNAIYCGVIGPNYLNIIYNYVHHVGTGRGSSNVYAINYRGELNNRTDINISHNYIDYVGNTTTLAGNSAGIWMGQSTATGTYSNVSLVGNTIRHIYSAAAGKNASGINIGIGWGNAIGNVTGMLITDNIITDMAGVYVWGIALEGNTPNAQVLRNSFASLASTSIPQFASSIYIPTTNRNSATVGIHNNDLSAAYYGVINQTTTNVDAGYNWWGNASGPFSPGSQVTTFVLYDPWFTNSAMNHIDSNLPVENLTQNLYYTTIQAAINAANIGDVIEASAGTYNEAVNVNKRLTLQGAGADQTHIVATGTVLQVIAGSSATDRSIVRNLSVGGGSTGVTAGSYTTLEGIVASGLTTYGINLSPSTDVILRNCTFANSYTAGVGMKISSTATVTNLLIDGCHFDNLYQGFYCDANSGSEPSLDNVTIINTTFNGNAIKGFYTERLSNALFDNVTVIGTGCLSTYGFGAGFDLNLKWKDYQNITVQNSRFEGCGINSTNGVGLTIKARDDGSYASNPATLSNVIVDNVDFVGNKNGLNFGEPGRDNNGPALPIVKNCTFDANQAMDLNNFSKADIDATINNSFVGAATNFDIETRVYHAIDNVVKGLVTWTAGQYYVPTANSIQFAINAVDPGAEIEIAGGTYTENLLINKTVILTAVNRDPIIIDGNGSGSVVTITANNVTLSGMTLRNSGANQDDAGIKIMQAGGCTISGNTVTENSNGIILGAANGNMLSGNTINGNDYYGIALVGSTGNTLEANQVYANGLDAIALDNAALLGFPNLGSTSNILRANTLSSNRDGIFVGEFCTGNSIINLNQINAVNAGINLWRSGAQIITANSIHNCDTGIRLLGSSGNSITGNSVYANAIGLKIERSWQTGVWYPSINNTISGNKLYGNTGYSVKANDNDGQDSILDRNWWGSPAAPPLETVRANNAISQNVLVSPWWINEAMTILSSDIDINVIADNMLIRDAENQNHAVQVTTIEDLRGFVATVTLPKAYFAEPMNFVIGTPFSALGETVLYAMLIDDNVNWLYQVAGSLLSIDAPDFVPVAGTNVTLFTFDAASLADPTNAWVAPIYTEVGVTDIDLRDAQNPWHHIPVDVLTGKAIVIDSAEPMLEALDEPAGLTLAIDPAKTFTNGFPSVVDTYLGLTFNDNYNLDYLKFKVQSATEPTDPSIPADFVNEITIGIDALVWQNNAWQIPDNILNAAVNNLPTGSYEIWFLAVDDAGNYMTWAWTFLINKDAINPLVWDLTNPCRTTAKQNNSIDLKWTNPAGTATNHIWAISYDDLSLEAGAYPEYNPAGFTLPAIPAAPNPYNSADQNGWKRVGIVPAANTQVWAGMTRGYYYVTAFAASSSGVISTAPAGTFYRESISYWPGDVDGVAPNGTNHVVTASDIAALSTAWGKVDGQAGFSNIVDVGPTVDNARRSRPTPDNTINIEDLMIFAMNYNNTVYTYYPRETQTPETSPIRIDMITETIGNQMIVRYILSNNNGLLKGLNIPMLYGTGLSLSSVVSGDIWPEESLILNADAANRVVLSASTLGYDAVVGRDGTIAILTFDINGSDLSTELQHMIARNIDNCEIEIDGNPEETPSGNDDPEIIVPVNSYLGDNYPNPFNPTTTISFGLKDNGNVRITIFNARGQVVRNLFNGMMNAGTHSIVWNGLDNAGRPLGSGVYYYRMDTDNYSKTKKSVLLK